MNIDLLAVPIGDGKYVLECSECGGPIGTESTDNINTYAFEHLQTHGATDIKWGLGPLVD